MPGLGEEGAFYVDWAFALGVQTGKEYISLRRQQRRERWKKLTDLDANTVADRARLGGREWVEEIWWPTSCERAGGAKEKKSLTQVGLSCISLW